MEAPRRRRIPMRRPEQAIQISCVELFKWILPPEVFFFHVPNGGARSPAEAGILKAMGVMGGVPDLNFIWQRRYYGIEVKKVGGTLSASQRETLPRMRAAGAIIEVAESVAEVISFLVEFGFPLKLGAEEIAYHLRKAAA